MSEIQLRLFNFSNVQQHAIIIYFLKSVDIRLCLLLIVFIDMCIYIYRKRFIVSFVIDN